MGSPLAFGPASGHTMDATPSPALAAPGSPLLFEDARSADYLQLALAAAEMGTWDWDPHTDVVTGCARMRAFFGLPAGPHHWAEVLDRIHPDDRAATAARVVTALETAHDYVDEYRVVAADGAVRWLSARGRVHHDPTGDRVRLHGVVTDVTARKEHEAKLECLARETQERVEELQAVLDNAPVAIWIAHDRECRRITGNAYAEQKLMHVPPHTNVSLSAPAEERRTDFSIWRDGRRLERHELPAQRATARGEVVQEEMLEFRFADGRRVHLIQNAVPLFGADNTIRGAVAIGAEITSLRRTEAALRETEKLFRLMADASPAPIWLADAHGATTFVNRAYRDFFGVDFADMPAPGNWQVLVHPEDLAGYAAAFARALEQRSLFHETARVRRADGEWRWIASYAAPVLDGDGNLTAMVGMSPDITEIKRAEEVLKSEARRLEALVRQRTTSLQESLAEMEAFSYNISHDMRAPLRAMHSFARFLDQEYGSLLPAQGRDYLARILAASARMDRLIQDVLVYSRAARTELKPERVPLARLVRTLFDAYPHLREASADFAIADDLPVVLGNDAALLQCFANVVGNALKFVAPGQRAVVQIWAEIAGGRARVFVRDRGIGIPLAAQPHIFDMFYRANPAYEGSGIGLAVTKTSIERMGGTIGGVSEPGRGSTFHFDLPLAP